MTPLQFIPYHQGSGKGCKSLSNISHNLLNSQLGIERMLKTVYIVGRLAINPGQRESLKIFTTEGSNRGKRFRSFSENCCLTSEEEMLLVMWLSHEANS